MLGPSPHTPLAQIEVPSTPPRSSLPDSRTLSVRRTLEKLERQLPRAPQRRELLLLDNLHRVVRNNSFSRPSVILRTPSPTRRLHTSSPSRKSRHHLAPPSTGPNSPQVSTVGSPDTSLSEITHPPWVSFPGVSEMGEMESLRKKLSEGKSRIDFLYRNFPLASLTTEDDIEDYEPQIVKLQTLIEGFSLNVDTLSDDFGAESIYTDEIDKWKDQRNSFEASASKYRKEVRYKIRQIRSSLSTPAPTREASVSGSSDAASSTGEAYQKKIAAATATSKAEYIKKCLDQIVDDSNEHVWEDAEDIDVANAMHSIKEWKRNLDNCNKNIAELQSLIIGNDLGSHTESLNRLKTLADKTSSDLEENIRRVKESDREKGLFSDRKTKQDPVQLPQFSGLNSEDFITFQEKFKKCCITNQIPKSDQVAKLREVLKGNAKKQVPERTDTMDRAWELLKAAYGDPMILLRHRKENLMKLGEYPDANTKSNPLKVVEWCLNFERIIDELIKVGERDDRLEMEMFNDSTVNSVVDLFPARLLFKMERLNSSGKEKLEEIVTIVEEERIVIQKVANRMTGTKLKIPNIQDQNKEKPNPNKMPRGYTVFKGGKKLPNCRICKALEEKGDNKDLYEEHQGNYPTGCPRYCSMTTEERKEIALAAKFCLRCHDPKVIFKTRDPSFKHDCPVSATRKNRFSCSVQRCALHSWICTNHKKENKTMMDKFTEELTRRNLVFCYLSQPENSPIHEGNDDPDQVSEKQEEEIATEEPDEHDPDLLNVHSSDVLIERNETPETPNEAVNHCAKGNHKRNGKCVDISLSEVANKLKKLTPDGELLSTKFKDQPLFMFFTAEGRTKDVNIFCDTGNSHVLFRDPIPKEELFGIKVRDGPFPLGAVGGTTVWANHEWACQIKTSGGSREILLGLTVDKITSKFPLVSLAEAELDLKCSDPNNKELQDLSVPTVVGGEVDILLGIQYLSLYPVEVHSLASGLTICKLRLKGSSGYTATIAGPHHSFNYLAEKVGNVSYLLSKFKEGIDHWRQFGASFPKPIPMTMDDIESAIRINKSELEGCDVLENSLPRLNKELNFSICSVHNKVFKYKEKNKVPWLQSETTDSFLDDSPKCSHMCCHSCGDELVLEKTPTGALDLTVFSPSNCLSGHVIYKSDHSAESISPTAAQNTPRFSTGDGEGTVLGSNTTTAEDSTTVDPTAADSDSISATIFLSGQVLKHNLDVNADRDSSTTSVDFLRFSAADEIPCSLDDAEGDRFCALGHEDSLHFLKHMVSSMDGPMKIEYRCPKCRQCPQCRNSVDTEKVSLREEAEDLEIVKSVKLDFKNQRIFCYLPLRGPEEDFLSTNYNNALKILDKQCALYSKEPLTKELIVKGMMKLFDKGHAKLLDDIPEQTKKSINGKKVHHYIPWRVQFKPNSVSTPARPVFDCSSKSPTRSDGSGGRCLNDAVMKGRSMSLNLLKMVLGFIVGTVGVSGDIKQFYNVFKLNEEQWNLQLFLWRENMDISSPVKTGIITTLIYGNKCSAPQTEEGMKQLADLIKEENPNLADFLLNGRFVDDLNTSLASQEEAERITKDADKWFNSLGMEVKGWCFSGRKPPESISEDGRIGVAGMSWNPEIDSLEIKYSSLHFGSVSRGRMRSGTITWEEFSDGKFANLELMNAFVPEKLTKRMIVSKFLSVFDILGHLIPLTSRMKLDVRRMVKETESWDDAVTNEHRTKWVKNFLDLEKLKGLQFTRPRMPEDAIDSKMRLMVFVDAAKDMAVVWAGVGFKRQCGLWSSSYLIGRSLLCPVDSTTPRNEMEALVAGSNMLWILRMILEKWVDTYILAGDAQIPLFWTLTDKKRLGLWHRTRAAQIRRGTEMENLFHVKTSFNVADGPTRPKENVQSLVGPGTEWECGLPWMTKDISQAIEDKILTPATDLVLSDNEKKDYDEGFVFDRTPDVLTRGHKSIDKLIHTSCHL